MLNYQVAADVCIDKPPEPGSVSVVVRLGTSAVWSTHSDFARNLSDYPWNRIVILILQWEFWYMLFKVFSTTTCMVLYELFLLSVTQTVR
jgi:hypothetical protein